LSAEGGLSFDIHLNFGLCHLTFSIDPLNPCFHLSAPEQIEEKSQDEADNNTGDNGEIELKVLPFDYDISWQSPNEWNLRHHREEQSHKNQSQSPEN